MNCRIFGAIAVVMLAPGFSSGESAIQYKYLDSRLGYIGEGVGDVAAMPVGLDVDIAGQALVLLKIRVLTTSENELSVTGFGDSGRSPGPFRHEVIGVGPDGGVTVLLDGGPGITGESNPLNGLASDGKGIYLFSGVPAAGNGAFTRLRYFSGKRRGLVFDSDRNTSQNRPGMFAKFSQSLSGILEKRRLVAGSVRIVPGPVLAVRVRGLPGWDDAGKDAVIGSDPQGREYQGGTCIGVDDDSNLYVLVSRRVEDDEFAVRRPQDLVVLGPDGRRLAVLELKPWRDDLWSSAGENIRIRGNGDILQLWSQGNQFSLRRWSFQK